MALNRGRRYGGISVTNQDFEMHILLISRSKLKSSMGTSTLLAGFALVRYEMPSCDFLPGQIAFMDVMCV